jgi:hypothetical protein
LPVLFDIVSNAETTEAGSRIETQKPD